MSAFVVDHVKTFLTCSLITIQICLLFLILCLCMYKVQKIWGDGLDPLGREHACPLETRYGPRFRTKFCCSRSHRFGAGRGLQNFGEAEALLLGIGAWLISWKHAPVPMYYHIKFRCSRSNHFGVIREIHQKALTTHIPPFKVTQGHWNQHWSVGCLLSPVGVP